MAFTFQAVADRARLPLNDADKTRWPDAELFKYGIDAYLLLRRYRPDIFLASFSSQTDFNGLALGSNFPSVDDMYLPVIADYVAARAEFKDDEAVLQERAQAFFSLFKVGAMGG